MENPQTRADYGLAVHEALTQLRLKALDKATLAERAIIENIYQKAVDDNVKASGVRVNRQGAVDSELPDDQAAIVAFGLKRARSFLVGRFKDLGFELKTTKSGSYLKNVVDMRIYEHLADVTAGGKVYKFCIHQDGKYILSVASYWESVNA